MAPRGVAALAALLTATSVVAQNVSCAAGPTLYPNGITWLNGSSTTLGAYAGGKVTLITNVASF